jgi:hypothetical protein
MGPNILAYFSAMSMTKKKKFYTINGSFERHKTFFSSSLMTWQIKPEYLSIASFLGLV